MSAEEVTQSVQNTLKHEVHRRALLTRGSFRAINTRIGSVDHQL